MSFRRRPKAVQSGQRGCAVVSKWLAYLEHHTPYVGAAVSDLGAACTLPNAGSCRASYNPNFSGDVRINGDWGSGDLLGARPQFLDPRAFVNPAPYTYGNTPGAGAYGLYDPAFWNQDIGVARQFRITERFLLDLRGEAFNLTNSVVFSGPASPTNATSLDINNANFGRIVGQQNTPRSIQLALKLSF